MSESNNGGCFRCGRPTWNGVIYCFLHDYTLDPIFDKSLYDSLHLAIAWLDQEIQWCRDLKYEQDKRKLDLSNHSNLFHSTP